MRFRGAAGGIGHLESSSVTSRLLIVAVFAVLGKAASTLKEMAVAWRYGVSAEVDAYVFAYNLVSWPVAVWAGVLAVSLIPLESRTRQESPAALQAFRAEQLGFTLLLGSVLTLVAAGVLPTLVHAHWVGLPEQTATTATSLTLPLAGLILPGLLVGLFSAWLMGEGKHANTLLEAMPAIGILAATLLAGSVLFLAVGGLLGAISQALILAWLSYYRRSTVRLKFSFRSREWSALRHGFALVILGQLVMSVTGLLDQFFAARLGEGTIGSMSYANRVLGLGIGVVATAVTRSTLPVFSDVAARSRSEAGKSARRWAVRFGSWGVIAACLGWLIAPLTVRLLFERGSFDAADTLEVVKLLRVGLVQLPFYVSSLVFVSLHASLGQYRMLFFSGILGLAVKGVSLWILLPALGASGLMLSSAFVYMGSTVLLTRTLPK